MRQAIMCFQTKNGENFEHKQSISSVPKSKRFHVVIFQFFFINLRYSSEILLEWWVIFLESRTLIGYFSNSTGSFVTTLICLISVGWKLVWPTLISEYLPWSTSNWMKFASPSQTLHPCTLGFFVVCHCTKVMFEHVHNSSTNCNIHLFFLPSSMEEEPLYTDWSK